MKWHDVVFAMISLLSHLVVRQFLSDRMYERIKELLPYDIISFSTRVVLEC